MPKLKNSNETFWVIFKQCAKFYFEKKIEGFDIFLANFLQHIHPNHNTDCCIDAYITNIKGDTTLFLVESVSQNNILLQLYDEQNPIVYSHLQLYVFP